MSCCHPPQQILTETLLEIQVDNGDYKAGADSDDGAGGVGAQRNGAGWRVHAVVDPPPLLQLRPPGSGAERRRKKDKETMSSILCFAQGRR